MKRNESNKAVVPFTSSYVDQANTYRSRVFIIAVRPYDCHHAAKFFTPLSTARNF